MCVPSLILTSSLNRGDSACSRRTLIPRPITVARLQWVIVGVISTSTCDIAERSCLSVTLICGRLTTASSPRLSGCSWSEMGEIRSWKNPILVSECPHGSCLYFSVLKKKKKSDIIIGNVHHWVYMPIVADRRHINKALFLFFSQNRATHTPPEIELKKKKKTNRKSLAHQSDPLSSHYHHCHPRPAVDSRQYCRK